jgi:hypothetical protein
MIVVTIYSRNGFISEICQLELTQFLARTINWYINGIFEEAIK